MKRWMRSGLVAVWAGSIAGCGLVGSMPAGAAGGSGAARSSGAARPYSAAETQQLLEQIQELQATFNDRTQAERDGYAREAGALRQQEDLAAPAAARDRIEQQLAQLQAADQRAETLRTQWQTRLEAAKDHLRRGETESFVDDLIGMTLPLPKGDPSSWLATWELRRDYLIQSSDNARFLIAQLPQTIYRPDGA